MNPKSLQNLKPFTSENQPPGEKKSRKGIPNRRTDVDKWLDVNMQITHPATKKKLKGAVRDEVWLQVIAEARKGDMKAAQLLFDSSYGKIVDKQEVTGANGEPLSFNIEIK